MLKMIAPGLRSDSVGIDDGAAINRADDPSDANRPILRHFNFHNLRQIGRENELKGDATADPVRQRLSPTRLSAASSMTALHGASCREASR
jgi:hypothetical protein